MFDDVQPPVAGQVPANLPIGEPEDMFAGAEPATDTASAPVESIAPPAGTSSALGAGVLRPKTEAQATVAPVAPRPSVTAMPTQNTVPPVQDPGMYRIKEPTVGRGIVVMIISAVAVAVVGGGGWYVYDRFVRTPAPVGNIPTNSDVGTTPEPVSPVVPTTETPAQPGTDATQVPNTPANTAATSSNVRSDIVDQTVLFGEPVDSDKDGLDDNKEKELGTNPNAWDTDSDGLSDRDEVMIWHTDPLKADTDGDGYNDGLEVKSGYNPVGPGKLFQPPTTTGK